MRGKPASSPSQPVEHRITPAHAGKTYCVILLPPCVWDHPRACGENALSATCSSTRRGSPPRMRGKHPTDTPFSVPDRITPAHAGKTSPNHEFVKFCRDHPRACGENVTRSLVLARSRGSPPRMRGKHFGKGVFPWLILVLSLDPL